MAKNRYYKHPTYGHVYGESLPTPLGRFCWVYLTKPKDAPPPLEGQQQGPPRYEITVLLDKSSSADFITSLKAMTDEMLALFNKGRSANLGECKLFGKNGDGDEADLEKYPYYKNCWVLTGRNAKAPKVVGPDRKPIDPKEVIGGHLGKVVITPLITAHGISYKLEAVQFVKDDGVRIGGSIRDTVELFDACDDAEEDPKILLCTDAQENTTVPASQNAEPQKTGKEAALDLL